MPDTTTILGIRFLNGDAEQAVTTVSENGGVLVVPAAPALVRLRHDEVYRTAMVAADYAIPDSGLMVLSWKILRNETLRRVSGLAYLQALIRRPELREPHQTFFVLPTEEARVKLIDWARTSGFQQFEPADCYVAPRYALIVEDRVLLETIAARGPRHIVIAIGNGPQEKLGVYLRDRLSIRPAIHCIGAALGFLTGDQVAIPEWADRFYLGWLLRLFAQPRIFIPRLTRAAVVPWLILLFGRGLPTLKQSRK
jgi:N-acetylglucosaminyldiphosphoundecaprenol N-acetyl-beta-D-mannosaminyltransferase